MLALPRGGVPVGYEVARSLGLPLDVFQVRKLGVPGREELAMGAVGSSGVYLNREVIEALQIGEAELDGVVQRERALLERRERTYREVRPQAAVFGTTCILVDDGVATGSSMFAAIEALRAQQPECIVAAVPVGPAETCGRLAIAADDVVCLQTPETFYAVGTWYEEFEQVGDDEVRALLANAAVP